MIAAEDTRRLRSLAAALDVTPVGRSAAAEVAEAAGVSKKALYDAVISGA